MKKGKNLLTFSLVLMLFGVVFSGSAMAKTTKVVIKDIDEITDKLNAVTRLSLDSVPVIQLVEDSDWTTVCNDEETYMNQTAKKPGASSVLRLFTLPGQLGKYSLKDGKIYLNKGALEDCSDSSGISVTVLQKMVAIQELVIALDDQNFNLKNIIGSATEPLATFALIQGHALAVADQVYSATGISSSNINNFDRYMGKSMTGPIADKGKDFYTYVTKNSALTIKDMYAKLPVGDSIMEPKKYVAGQNKAVQVFPASFGPDIQKELPWKFKYNSFNSIDKLSMFFITKFFSPNATSAVGFEGGISLQFSPTAISGSSAMSMFQGMSMPSLGGGTLMVSVCKFTSPKDAEAYYNSISMFMMTSMMGTMKADQKTPDIDLKKSKAKYPNAFIFAKKVPGYNDVVIYLSPMKSNYLIQVAGTNLKMTDDNLLQLIDSITKRL